MYHTVYLYYVCGFTISEITDAKMVHDRDVDWLKSSHSKFYTVKRPYKHNLITNHSI